MSDSSADPLVFGREGEGEGGGGKQPSRSITGAGTLQHNATYTPGQKKYIPRGESFGKTLCEVGGGIKHEGGGGVGTRPRRGRGGGGAVCCCCHAAMFLKALRNKNDLCQRFQCQADDTHYLQVTVA